MSDIRIIDCCTYDDEDFRPVDCPRCEGRALDIPYCDLCENRGDVLEAVNRITLDDIPVMCGEG